MLNALSVRNIVLIDQLDLALDSGMTVLTGETGAGKSILLDALTLALGGRGDASLVKEGADIHGLDTRPGVAGSNGRRPLNWAALQNDTAMIELLLELGADIDRQNLSGFTPLHHAVEVQAVEAIELLLRRGADTTIRNRNNLTPAEYARATRRGRAAEALGVGPQVE